MRVDPPAGEDSPENGRKDGVLDLIRQNRPGLLLGLAGMAVKEMLKTPEIAWKRRQIRSRGQRAIGYIGWIGHGNLGDEAVFEAISGLLSVDESLIQFLAAEGESMLQRFGVGGMDVFRAVLFGGGTLIHPYYLPVGRLAQKFGIPMYTVGTGVGSPGFFTPENPSLAGWKPILQGCELLSVRGPLSYELLQDLGLPQVEVIGDPALGLAPDRAPVYRTRQRLVINLAQESRPTADSGEHAMHRQLAKLSNDFADRGGELIGVALGAKDRGALEMFRREHGVGRLQIEDHRTSTQDLFETVSGSIGLVGVRLHSAVLASCVGVPSILFAYRNKCRDFMASMDLGDFALDISREEGPRRMAECFERLMFEADLGPGIYAKAVFWKLTQRQFYGRLAKSIAGLQGIS